MTQHTIRRARAMKAKKARGVLSNRKISVPKPFHRDVNHAVKILRDAGCSEVYLFGSVVSGRSRVGSDLDLAIRGCPSENFFHVLGLLLMELDHSVDLVDLDSQDPFARYLQKRGALVRIN